jgi:transposase
MGRKGRTPTLTQPDTQTDAWPTVNANAAGIDIGTEQIWVCVPCGRDAESVRCFGTFTPDLQHLAEWLKKCGVATVAMESTGVYWIPLYELLEESGFVVALVNPTHLNRVPGRKSDTQDCQWIQRLHGFGLLSPSFRPTEEICTLRAYVRQRANLIKYRAAHIQHMQKALSLMNVQLALVLSDIVGATGLAIIRAIVAGERDPMKLAALRDRRCKHPESQIIKALTGHYRREHVFALKQALAVYDSYSQQIAECDAETEEYLKSVDTVTTDDPPPLPASKDNSHCKNAPGYDARTLLYRITGVDLVAITGLNENSVQTILSEVGTDMSRFPSEKHFCSWLGLAPHHSITGGKVLSRHTVKTANRAGQVFRIAAQAVGRSLDSVYGAFYRRMKAKLGPQRATVATAHKLARAFYHMLKHRVPFQDTGARHYEQRTRERELAGLAKRAASLGFTLQPAPAAGSS